MSEFEVKDGLAANERIVDGTLEYRSRDGHWQKYTIAALSGLLMFERSMYAAAKSRASLQ